MSRERGLFGRPTKKSGESTSPLVVEVQEPARPAKLYQAGQVRPSREAAPELPPTPVPTSSKPARQNRREAARVAQHAYSIEQALIQDYLETQAQKTEAARLQPLRESLFSTDQIRAILIHDVCTANRLSTSQALPDKQVVEGLNYVATMLSLKPSDFQTVYDFAKTAANLLQRSQLGWLALILNLNYEVSTISFDGNQLYSDLLDFLAQGHADDAAAKLAAVALIQKPFQTLLKRGQSL